MPVLFRKSGESINLHLGGDDCIVIKVVEVSGNNGCRIGIASSPGVRIPREGIDDNPPIIDLTGDDIVIDLREQPGHNDHVQKKEHTR